MHLVTSIHCSIWSLLVGSLREGNILLCCNHSLLIINHTLRLFVVFFYPPNQWRVFLGYIPCSMVWLMSLDYWWDSSILLLWIKVLKFNYLHIFSQSLTWYQRKGMQELSLHKQLKPTWSWEVLNKELGATASISIQLEYQFEDTSKLKERVWIILEENDLDVYLNSVSEDSLCRAN